MLRAFGYLVALVIMSTPAWADDCVASMATPLGPLSSGYDVFAYTQGIDCTKAIAVISIRDASTRRIWALSYNAADIQPLASAATSASMSEGLRQWMVSYAAAFRTSASLPTFRRGGSLESGPYRFFPARGLSRDAYNKIRQRKLPILCYAEAPQSAACVVVDRVNRDAVIRVGSLDVP